MEKQEIVKRIMKPEEIRDFFNKKGEFGYGFNDTDYNTFVTMKGIKNWGFRVFRVYHGEGVDEKDPIVNEFVKIVSESDCIPVPGIVNYCRPLPDNSGHKFSIFEIKVSEIEMIEFAYVKR